MKNFLCYLGIIVLIVLIALPPVLRLTLKDEGEEEEEEVHVVRKTLSCDSDNYLTRTSYENDEITAVTIKKIETKIDTETNENEESTDNQDDTTSSDNEETQSPNETPENQEEETEFDKLFNTLKEDSRVVKQEVEDGVIIKLDFTTSDYNGLLISDLIKSADEEKIYYENQKMICNIIE